MKLIKFDLGKNDLTFIYLNTIVFLCQIKINYLNQNDLINANKKSSVKM